VLRRGICLRGQGVPSPGTVESSLKLYNNNNNNQKLVYTSAMVRSNQSRHLSEITEALKPYETQFNINCAKFLLYLVPSDQ